MSERLKQGARRALGLALPVLPLLLAIACLALADAAEQTDAPPVVPVAGVAPTRLIVFLVDSLDRRDVETPHAMPKLARRLQRSGLRGHVLACVDAVTIPCVTAMITGFDRASSFSPLRNFGGAREVAGRSVLGTLERRGYRVGYFGDPLLARALEGLSVVRTPRARAPTDDAETLRAALSSLLRDDLDVLFIHLLALDEAAHKFTALSSEYAEVRRQIDAQLDHTMGALRESDHVVILGDHGHAESGRHSAGVGTDTFAAYFGPRFQQPVERQLAMTDHARIWARLFGLRWGERSWVDAAFGEAPPLAPTSTRATLAVRPRAWGPLALALALALVLAAAGSGQALQRRRSWSARRVAALVAGGGAMLTMSFLLPLLWRFIETSTGALLVSLLLGVLGACCARAFVAAPLSAEPRGVHVRGLLLSGALLWALPTAEPMAGVKTPVLWLALVLVAVALRALSAGRALRLATTLLSLFALTLLSSVAVRGYLPRLFQLESAGTWLGMVLPALLIVPAVGCASGLRPALVAAAGCLLAQLVAGAASAWLLIPCALVLPLSFVAFRKRWLFEPVCFLLPVACGAFFYREPVQLAFIALTWLLWALLPWLLRDESSLLRAALAVLLMWLSFWVTMSTRIGGVEYDFYFRWLPHEAPATSEAIRQGLLTAAKSMLPPVFGALLAQRRGVLPVRVLRGAEHLTRVRLALTIVFLVGISLGRGTVDVHLLYDATQEVAFWLLMFAVLGLISAANQVGLATDARAAMLSTEHGVADHVRRMPART